MAINKRKRPFAADDTSVAEGLKKEAIPSKKSKGQHESVLKTENDAAMESPTSPGGISSSNIDPGCADESAALNEFKKDADDVELNGESLAALTTAAAAHITSPLKKFKIRVRRASPMKRTRSDAADAKDTVTSSRRGKTHRIPSSKSSSTSSKSSSSSMVPGSKLEKEITKTTAKLSSDRRRRGLKLKKLTVERRVVDEPEDKADDASSSDDEGVISKMDTAADPSALCGDIGFTLACVRDMIKRSTKIVRTLDACVRRDAITKAPLADGICKVWSSTSTASGASTKGASAKSDDSKDKDVSCLSLIQEKNSEDAVSGAKKMRTADGKVKGAVRPFSVIEDLENQKTFKKASSQAKPPHQFNQKLLDTLAGNADAIVDEMKQMVMEQVVEQFGNPARKNAQIPRISAVKVKADMVLLDDVASADDASFDSMGVGLSGSRDDWLSSSDASDFSEDEDEQESSHVKLLDDDNKKLNDNLAQLQTNTSNTSVMSEMPSAWPSNVIPFQIDPTFSKLQKNNILTAFSQYHDNTCVRFKPWAGEMDYVYIRRAPNESEPCTSNLGYQGGQQVVTLNDKCVELKGTIIHELMHVLGFDHEQSRRDRDNYIAVNWNNIIPGYERNFKQRPHITDLSYDYGSIMHYPPYAFAEQESVPTLVPKMEYPLRQMGQRVKLSNLDQTKINQIYRCDRHPVRPSSLYPTPEFQAESYIPYAEEEYSQVVHHGRHAGYILDDPIPTATCHHNTCQSRHPTDENDHLVKVSRALICSNCHRMNSHALAVEKRGIKRSFGCMKNGHVQQ